MQLLIEPFIQAHRLRSFDVTWLGAEGETIKRMEDAVSALNLRRLIGLAVHSLYRRLIGGGSYLLSSTQRGRECEGPAKNDSERRFQALHRERSWARGMAGETSHGMSYCWFRRELSAKVVVFRL